MEMEDLNQTGSEEIENNVSGVVDTTSDNSIDESRSWINELPADLKEAKAWNKFTKGEDTQMVSVPESLLKSHLSLEGMLSNQKRVPDTEEEKTAFYEEMGWKSNFDDYSKGVKRAEMPDGVEYDAAEEEYLLQLAHEAKVPISQVQQSYDKIVKAKLEAIEANRQSQADYQDNIANEFKREFGGDLDVMKNRARTAIEQYESPEFIDILDNAEYQGKRLGDHPGMFKFFAKLGRDKIGLGNERGSDASQSDSSSIQEQIDTLMASKPYWDADDINHKSTVQKVQNLYKRQHGEI